MHSLLQLQQAIQEHLDAKKPLNTFNQQLLTYVGGDWKQHVTFTQDTYNRIVLKDNADYELVLVCWQAQQKTIEHKHPSGGCLFTILYGALTEERNIQTRKYTITCTTKQTYYLDNSIGTHNVQAQEETVSLHIYAKKR